MIHVQCSLIQEKKTIKNIIIHNMEYIYLKKN